MLTNSGFLAGTAQPAVFFMQYAVKVEKKKNFGNLRQEHKVRKTAADECREDNSSGQR
jgi:hypothetical protein